MISVDVCTPEMAKMAMKLQNHLPGGSTIDVSPQTAFGWGNIISLHDNLV